MSVERNSVAVASAAWRAERGAELYVSTYGPRGGQLAVATVDLAGARALLRDLRRALVRAKIPPDWPVQPLGMVEKRPRRAECGNCGLAWDDDAVTLLTPAPAGRCPFEYFHEED